MKDDHQRARPVGPDSATPATPIQPPDAAPDPAPRFRLMLREGWRLLKTQPKYVRLFLALSAITSMASVATALLFGHITSQIQRPGNPDLNLRLLTEGTRERPETATNLVVIANSPGGLHFWVFDSKGAMVADQAEAEIPEDLDGLKGTLEGLWDGIEPDKGRIDRILAEIGAIHSLRPASRTLLGAYLLWAALLLGTLAVGFASRWAQTTLDFSMSGTLRDRLFGSLLRRNPEFYHTHDSGTLTMIANEMSVEAQVTLREIVLEPVVQLFAFMTAAVGIRIAFSRLHDQGGWLLWAGVGVILLAALASPIAVNRLAERLRRASAGVRDQRLALAALVNGALASPEEIQVFRAENAFAARHRQELDNLRRTGIRQALVMERVNVLNRLPAEFVAILFIGMAVSLIYLAPENVAGAGFLVAILLLIPQVMMPIQSLSSYLVMAHQSWPSVERVLSLLDDAAGQPHAPPAATASSAPPAPRDSTLGARDLTFRYRPDLPPVFNNVSFDVPPGKITALVARKGQGKTTFFRLILRFYDPDRGQVLLGGAPTTTLDPEGVRDQVTLMSQFPAFFHDTLRENLRIAKPDATDQEIETLCRRTGIWPVLQQGVGSQAESLPNPLDRQFAAARTLSGGQKKLLALTRCLLRSPTHLLLDEPTVGMDNLEKFGLIPDLQQICAARTVVAVDHDVHWLLKFCDHFLVLDQGRIVQQGGRELAEQPGLFRDLLDKARNPVPSENPPALLPGMNRPEGGRTR